MTDNKPIPERADKLFRRMEAVLDDYENELERLESEDELTEEFLYDMIKAEHHKSQLAELCKLVPEWFVDKYAFIADMSEKDIFHKILVKGEDHEKET